MKRQEHFEYICRFVAAGFDPKSEHVESLDNDYKNGGLFIMTKDDVSRIKDTMTNLKCTAKVKFSHMLAYQMELGYNLALSPDDIVSSNPDFDTVLGVLSTGE